MAQSSGESPTEQPELESTWEERALHPAPPGCDSGLTFAVYWAMCRELGDTWICGSSLQSGQHWGAKLSIPGGLHSPCSGLQGTPPGGGGTERSLGGTRFGTQAAPPAQTRAPVPDFTGL